MIFYKKETEKIELVATPAGSNESGAHGAHRLLWRLPVEPEGIHAAQAGALQGDLMTLIHLQIKSYQDQFVETRFPRIWSNRDMDIFSFRPISPQFA